MKKKYIAGGIIAGVVAIIFAIAMIPVISDLVSQSSTIPTYKEDLIFKPITQNDTTTYGNIISITQFNHSALNSNANLGANNYTIDKTTGRIDLASNVVNKWNGTYTIGYSYYADITARDSITRLLVPIILIMFAVGILVLTAGIVGF